MDTVQPPVHDSRQKQKTLWVFVVFFLALILAAIVWWTNQKEPTEEIRMITPSDAPAPEQADASLNALEASTLNIPIPSFADDFAE